METTNVMKSILTILISFGLALSVFGQTRNVVVGTNGAIVQPTNFWSADVTNARSGLGLGSAATNSSSAFQPSSVALSNLASSNGSILTNIQASNIVGVISSSNISSVVFTNISGVLTVDQGGTSATNAYDARQNFGITAIGDALFTASNAATARTAIGGTDVGSSVFTLANPSAITFLRVNGDNTVSAIGASDFRTAIGLGSSATNASSAFQPASSMLTNLASSNAFYLSNIQASNITGLLGLTNGGTGADNAINARANLGLGSASTNPASAFQPSSAVLSNLASSNGVNLTNITISNLTGVLTTNGNGAGLTNLTAANITGTVALASNVTGTIAISNGGTGATNAATARTNLGLGATNSVQFNSVTAGGAVYANSFESTNYGVLFDIDSADAINIQKALGFPTNIAAATRTNLKLGAAWLTNTVSSNFRSAIGLGISNNVFFNDVQAFSFLVGDETNSAIYFEGDSAARTRTNLGLGWPALTNTNSGTGLVSVNTNGTVVSPTNFWDVAPIQTLVQNFTPVANATNAATNARTLYAYSLAISTVGVTNVITLPTNTATKNGDEVTVIHMGPTSSVTAIRQLGQTNNLITINKTDESVKFIYENNAWTNFHNISFVEPIQFSGTNASANAAASRTNLGLGEASTVTFQSIFATGQLSAFIIYASSRLNLPAVAGSFVNDIWISNGLVRYQSGSLITSARTLLTSEGNLENIASAATARTNLGLPLAALTNTSTTNFQKDIFYTNTAPSNIGGNLGTIAAWIEIVASNGVTYKVPAYTNIP